MKRLAALLVLLAFTPARADILLSGKQHIGDDDSATFTPPDPVTRTQMKANPTHFYLPQSATITAARLDNTLSLDNNLRFYIDDAVIAGTLSGSTYTFTAPLAISAGSHTIVPDGGCLPSGFTTLPTNCGAGENDVGFDSITLLSSSTQPSGADHRRHHLGDSIETARDNYGGRWYPDAPDLPGPTTSFVDVTFTADITRVLSEIRFWKLRDVNTPPQTYPTVKLDGVQIGTLNGNGSPYILSSGAVVAAGTHTLRITTGIASGVDLDDISWDDIVTILINNPATTPGYFNAVETSTPAADVASGVIKTRIAGASNTVSLVALTLGGVQLSVYTGTLTVSVLDATNTTGVLVAGTNCDAGWVDAPASALGSATFAAIDAGRKDFTFTYTGNLTNAGALPDARLKMYDAALGVTGCSTDNFALRPASFGTLLVSHNTSDTAGTAVALATSGFAPTTTPVHKAGAPFTLRATAYNAAGAVIGTYAGSPTFDFAASSTLLGTNKGIASVAAWTASGGTVTSNSATYSEAGAARLALVDTTYASVDAVDGSTTAQRDIGPFYVDVGRFIPDHFTFTDTTAGGARFVAGCNGGITPFTYAGQPFVFAVTPTGTITAASATGTVVTNYAGTLYKLTVNPQSSYLTTAAAASFDLTRVPSPTNNTVSNANGVTLYTVIPAAAPGYVFTKGNTPAVPFDADVAIRIDFTESDGVTLSGTPGFGTATADGGIPFAAGGVTTTAYNEVRYGRLVIESAHGSERLPLQVPLRAEYFASVGGGNGFARNLLDSGGIAGCTGNALMLGDFTIAPSGGATVTASALTTMNAGLATLTLDAPLLGGVNVSADVALTALISGDLPWLQVDNGDADAVWNNDPTGVASFGLFRSDDRRIYQREVISP